MIRPLTFLCALLFGAAVLYTYQSKHEVQVLDQQIEKTVHDTGAVREQTRVLKAEWTLLENPERLRQFADQYTTLKPVQPNQFTSLADLDAKLPAPQAIEPDHGTTDMPPVAEAPQATQTMADATDAPELPADDAVATDDLPVPPLPVPPPPMSVVTTVATTAPSPMVERPVGERKPNAPRSAASAALAPDLGAPVPLIRAASNPISSASAPRQPEPRQAPVNRPPIQAQAPMEAPTQPRYQAHAQPPVQAQPQYNGSLLGMAQGGGVAPMPLPRPIPVNATSWKSGD